MTNEELIQKTAEHVKELFTGEGSGHDWWHIYRVWNNAKMIAKGESGVDLTVVELGALLHDIADFKAHGGDEEIGGKTAAEWLKSLGADENLIEQVKHIVDNISFKGAASENKIKSIEGKIVQDADRLDAIGAIGIGRTFAYGGHSGAVMYDPEDKFKAGMTKEEYKNNKGSTINHFYEKLLLLKDLMNTETAKKIAKDRHEYMEKFLEEFYAEWEGEK